jgi:hypothetical protein
LKNAQDFGRFPHLAEKVSNADRLSDEKAVIFLQRYYPEKLIGGFPIKAVLVPRITEQTETRLLPTASVQALKALAPSSLFQVPGAGHEKFQMLAKLVKQVPCFSLELGSDIAAIPHVIVELLEQY